MGLAVHTGEVFAGNVGGSARLKYAVVGDPVNVAARLEGLNKELGTALLITEATRMALGNRVEVKDRGAVQVRGRTEPFRVHEVLGVDGYESGPGGGADLFFGRPSGREIGG
jgi:adenylate cyclase